MQPHQPPPVRNITELIAADDLLTAEEKGRKPLFDDEPGAQAWSPEAAAAAAAKKTTSPALW